MDYYMIFDGRANYDLDAAMVLEALGHVSEKKAWAAMEDHAKDSVLVKFESEGLNGTHTLSNPEIIYK